MKSPTESTRLILVLEQDIVEIKEILSKILQKIDGNAQISAKEWLSENEAKEYVPRGRTWYYNKRKKGIITSTKIGGQPFYLKESLMKFIEKNRKDSYRID